MGLSKLILCTVKKKFKSLEKRCQNLVTVTVTGRKRKIYCTFLIIMSVLDHLVRMLMDVTVTLQNQKKHCTVLLERESDSTVHVDSAGFI